MIKITNINLQKKSKMSGGFTLVEILIVMVIIGILSTLGFGSFQSSQIKSRDSRRKSDLTQMTRALELYFNDKGSYPLSSGGQIVGCGPAGGKTACSWGDSFEETIPDRANTVYMVSLPEDPKAPTLNYFYYANGAGDFYQIYARLENENDAAIEVDAEDDPQAYSGVSCGAELCNFGVSSANSTPEEGRVFIDG